MRNALRTYGSLYTNNATIDCKLLLLFIFHFVVFCVVCCLLLSAVCCLLSLSSWLWAVGCSGSLVAGSQVPGRVPVGGPVSGWLENAFICSILTVFFYFLLYMNQGNVYCVVYSVYCPTVNRIQNRLSTQLNCIFSVSMTEYMHIHRHRSVTEFAITKVVLKH